VGVGDEFDASEEVAAGVGGLGSDGDLTLGQKGDERWHLRQIGVSLLDGDVGVLVKRAAAGKAGFGDQVAQDSRALAVVGDLRQRRADIGVGAGSEHLVSDWDAGEGQSVLLQRQLDLDGGSHVLKSLSFQGSINRSRKDDGVLSNRQRFDVESAATAALPLDGLGGGNSAKEDNSRDHLHLDFCFAMPAY